MWKGRSKKSWDKSHELLWPGVELPEFLTPLATRAAPEEEDHRRGHFMESTIPTSYVFASLLSASTSMKKMASGRYRAMEVFYELLVATFRTGKLDLTLQTNQGDETIRVPPSGNVQTGTLFGHLSPNRLDELKNLWAMEMQD